MIQQRCSFLFVLAIAVFFAGNAAVHAAPAKTSKDSEAAKPVGRVVEYQELENQVGATIVVETNLKTARRGILIKYTNPALTLQLGPEAGSIELSVPHDSIRRITLLDPAPASATAPGKQ